MSHDMIPCPCQDSPYPHNFAIVSISTAHNKLSSVELTAVQTNMSLVSRQKSAKKRIQVRWRTLPQKTTSDHKDACAEHCPDSRCTVCLKKNIPDIFSCNFRKHYRIFIIFGTHVTEKVSNQ